jgi:hypothetical protein
MIREGTAGTNDGDGLAQTINRRLHQIEPISRYKLLISTKKLLPNMASQNPEHSTSRLDCTTLGQLPQATTSRMELQPTATHPILPTVSQVGFRLIMDATWIKSKSAIHRL